MQFGELVFIALFLKISNLSVVRKKEAKRHRFNAFTVIKIV